MWKFSLQCLSKSIVRAFQKLVEIILYLRIKFRGPIEHVASIQHCMCDRIGNSGRNWTGLSGLFFIWPEPELDCHPKKCPDSTGLAGSCQIFLPDCPHAEFPREDTFTRVALRQSYAEQGPLTWTMELSQPICTCINFQTQWPWPGWNKVKYWFLRKSTVYLWISVRPRRAVRILLIWRARVFPILFLDFTLVHKVGFSQRFIMSRLELNLIWYLTSNDTEIHWIFWISVCPKKNIIGPFYSFE